MPALGKGNADDEWEHSVVEEKWFALSAWNVWVVALYKHQKNKKNRWNIKHWASVAALTSVRHPPYFLLLVKHLQTGFAFALRPPLF